MVQDDRPGMWHDRVTFDPYALHDGAVITIRLQCESTFAPRKMPQCRDDHPQPLRRAGSARLSPERRHPGRLPCRGVSIGHTEVGRSGRIRTCGPRLPKTVLYQAELHSGASVGRLIAGSGGPCKQVFDQNPRAMQNEISSSRVRRSIPSAKPCNEARAISP